MAGDHTIVVESQSALFSASPPPPQCLAAWVGTARQCVAGFIQGWGGATRGDGRGEPKGFRGPAKMLLNDRLWPRRWMWERSQDRTGRTNRKEAEDRGPRKGCGGEATGWRALEERRGQAAGRVTVCVDGDVIQKDCRGHGVGEGCKPGAKVFGIRGGGTCTSSGDKG